MNERLKQFSPETPETLGAYADWSDDQRMSEYAYTGNGEYLTPELARRMKVGYEAMQEVPNATEEDMELARGWGLKQRKKRMK